MLIHKNYNVMRTKYLLIIGMIISFLLSACGGKNSADGITHFAYQETENGKWGIISVEGEVVMPPTFSNITTAVADEMFYTLNDNDDLELRNIKDPKKIIDTYSSATWFSKGIAYTSKKGERISCIDKQGNVLYQLPSDIVVAMAPGNNMVVIKNKEGKYGYINVQGEFIIPCKYQLAYPYHNEYALVMEDEENIYFIDKKGHKVAEINGDNKEETLYFIYNHISLWNHGIWEGVIPYVADGNKFGLKKINDDIIVPADEKYKAITCVYNGFCIYQTDNGYGIMDKSGETVINDRYTFIGACNPNHSQTFVACLDNDKCGILSLQEEQLCPFVYDNIIPIENSSFFLGIKDKELYIISKTGNIKKEFYNLNDKPGSFALSNI